MYHFEWVKVPGTTVGKPRTDSVPPTMQSQIPKSRDVTLFFFRHDALQESGHALFTSTPHVFLLNIFISVISWRPVLEYPNSMQY
jgi:hypothetical protein